MTIALLAAMRSASAAQEEWSVTIEKDPKIGPIIVGQDFSFGIKAVNKSGGPVRVPIMGRAREIGRLTLVVKKPDGSIMGSNASPYRFGEERDYRELGANGEEKESFTLRKFGYSAQMLANGEHSLEVAYEPEAGKRYSGHLKVAIHDVCAEDVVLSKPLRIEYPDRQSDKVETVLTEKLRLDGKYFLYYRLVIEGKCCVATCLGEVKENTDFDVAGDKDGVLVSFASGDGKKVQVMLEPLDGTIKKSVVSDR